MMLALTMSLLAYYLNYRPLSGVSRRKSFLIANRMAIVILSQVGDDIARDGDIGVDGCIACLLDNIIC